MKSGTYVLEVSNTGKYSVYPSCYLHRSVEKFLRSG